MGGREGGGGGGGGGVVGGHRYERGEGGMVSCDQGFLLRGGGRDHIVESVVDIWDRKPRRIAVC